MTKPITYLLSFLLFLGGLAFAYGIYKACALSLPEHPNLDLMPPFLAGIVTSIAAVLSTNLGAVLGITISDPSSHFRKNRNWNPLVFLSTPDPTILQTGACYIYILGLIAAAIVWSIKGFDIKGAPPIIPLIPELTKSLAGVIVGVLAIFLNRPSKP